MGPFGEALVADQTTSQKLPTAPESNTEGKPCQCVAVELTAQASGRSSKAEKEAPKALHREHRKEEAGKRRLRSSLTLTLLSPPAVANLQLCPPARIGGALTFVLVPELVPLGTSSPSAPACACALLWLEPG